MANFHSTSGPKTLLLTLAAGLALAALPASAGLPPVSLSKVFTPSTIGPGSVSTITFTVTNNNASPVTGLAFTDDLPAAITIADPANASTSCDLGISGTLTAPDGGSTITLSDARIGGSSSCTITVDVTSSTPGTHTNPAVTLTSSAGTGTSQPVDLTVTTTLPGFSKSFAPSSIDLGERSTLTFIIDNTANASPVLNLDFTDNLPPGMEIADPAVASTTCGSAVIPPTLTAAAGTSIIILDANGTFALPALAAFATCTVTVDVVANAGGMLDNLSGELLAELVSAGKASATLAVAVAALHLIKDFTDDPVPPGGTVTLEFTIDNFDRDFSATGVAFTDDLTTLVPALPGLTFASLLSNDCGGSVSGVGGTTIGFSGGTVAPQASCTLRVSLSVPAAATPGAYTNTTTAVTATVGGSPVAGNTASDDLFVEPAPVLTKEFLEVGTLAPDPVVDPGDDVVLRFTISNTSTASGATDVAFIDELTDGGPGTGFLPFPVSVTLPPVPDPPCGAGSSLALISLGTDRQGLSLTGGTLAAAPGAGSTCTFDVTLTIPAGLGPGIYVNTTEEITATVDDDTRIGRPASDTLTVIAAPTLTKAFTDDPVAPGGTVTLEFTLSYPPDASGDATAITFTDDLAPVLAGLTASLPPTPDPPCGAGSSLTGSAGGTLLTLTGGTLMPGQSCAFSVTLDVPAGAATGTYTNTTSGVGALVQGLPAVAPAASDDLRVAGVVFAKEFLGDPVVPGDTVTLRFTIVNVHPTDGATSIAFSDNLANVLPGTPDLTSTGPPTVNTCGGTEGGSSTFLLYSGGSLMAGLTCTIEYQILVPAGAADGNYNNVTSSLTATQSGGAMIIDPAVDVLTIDSIVLQLTKAFTDDPVAPGDSVTLEFTLANLDAGQAAAAIAFSDDLGAALAGLTFDSVLLNTCGGTVAGTGTGLITVSGVSLAAGGSCTLRVSLTVPGAAAAGIYTNTTSAVSGTISGLAVSGDAASDRLRVLQLLLFGKSFDGPTTATGTATLTFTITNPGAAAATDISFTDDLNAVIPGLIATSLPAVPCGTGSSITGIAFLTFSGGNLAPSGGTCSFEVDVLVPAIATPGTFPNTTSDLFRAGLEVSEPATADLVIVPPPTFAKSFAPNSIGPGQSSTLTFTIDNSASALAASNLDFTDNLPAGIVVATPSITSSTCGGTLTATAGTGVISLAGGSVGAGGSCTVQIAVTGVAVGAHVNVTGDLTSSSGNSGAATDTLAVLVGELAISKSFVLFPVPPLKGTAPPVLRGGLIVAEYTITNASQAITAVDIGFSDDLAAALPGLAAVGLPVADVCGAGSQVAGTSVVNLTGGILPPDSSCIISVVVQVPADAPLGLVTSTTGPVTGDYSGVTVTGGPASADLEVVFVDFVKEFGAGAAVGGPVTLTFTLTNPDAANAIDDLTFTDDLDAVLPGLEAIGLPESDVCGTGSVLSGTASIVLTGGSLGPSGSCSFTVTLQIPANASGGEYDNVTSVLAGLVNGLAVVGDPAGAATDTLEILGTPLEIPTLTGWGLLVLSGLLALFGVRRLHR